jgi:predicted MFS family arabinose efflux permease
MGLAGDKLDNRRVFIIGLATMTAAFIWLLLLKEVVPLFIFGAAFGFAFGGVQSSESPIVAWLFGIRSHGAIFGMTCSAFTIGSGLGSFLTGLIYDASQSYHTAFIITLILSLTGLGLTVSLRRLGKV